MPTAGQASGGTRTGSGREETEEERADRNLSDLLQELRVALPGVQVLFAFLLTVPFSQGFPSSTTSSESSISGCCAASRVATVLLVAPTAGHRILFRLQQKEYLVTVSNRLALAGLLVLAVSLMRRDRADQRLPLQEPRPGDHHGRDRAVLFGALVRDADDPQGPDLRGRRGGLRRPLFWPRCRAGSGS